ncbi:hypothetical protein [Micromonospora sp. DH14]|uniref:hypothetical protein n=1 Tax=Micromonospora sp. DH14 TaxID=3040120 RepID=UPI00244192ED|nr:hypothetical protein [Micromonospora sp. DH14]MDG9674240.1 hypothetical protein [Micromonospora sp. DH14]
MSDPRAFWLDEQFDREHGVEGRGRYEAEVRGRIDEFTDSWGDFAPVAFAVTAWRLATELSPTPEGPDDDVAAAARRAVVVLARELNDLLAPMIGQLDAGVPADS